MHRELIILPTTEEAQYFSGKENHSTYALRYLQEKQLDKNLSNDTASYKISYEMAKLGFCNIHIDNYFLVCFLPNKLTKVQEQWFNDNKKGLVKFEIHIAAINKDGVFDFIEEVQKSKQIKTLYKMIKERTIIEEKKLVKKWI